jgi:hypothetical protein
MARGKALPGYDDIVPVHERENTVAGPTTFVEPRAIQALQVGWVRGYKAAKPDATDAEAAKAAEGAFGDIT